MVIPDTIFVGALRLECTLYLPNGLFRTNTLDSLLRLLGEGILGRRETFIQVFLQRVRQPHAAIDGLAQTLLTFLVKKSIFTGTLYVLKGLDQERYGVMERQEYYFSSASAVGLNRQNAHSGADFWSGTDNNLAGQTL